MNADGKMDKKEFSIAMYLIQKKLQGHELPKMLPQGLKADPVAVSGGFGGMVFVLEINRLCINVVIVKLYV